MQRSGYNVSSPYQLVESHQWPAAHQAVLSGGVWRWSERTLRASPRLKASASLAAVASSRAPTHGMNMAGLRKRAAKVSAGLSGWVGGAELSRDGCNAGRVINSMAPTPG